VYTKGDLKARNLRVGGVSGAGRGEREKRDDGEA
jgi:hypothetical protein